MDFDLRDILDAWPYDPEDATRNFRKVELSDGRTVVQVREPMGVQQFEYEGRPDGKRPKGKRTLLEFYRERSRRESDFSLSREDCLELMQEGILFYQRYLVLYQLEDWPGVERDTARNLSYFDFARRHIENDEDTVMIEQYRPYLMRMNSIAKSFILWSECKQGEAIALLEQTLSGIEALQSVNTTVFQMEADNAVRHLKRQIDEFKENRPPSRVEILREQQSAAIKREDFELAARLRDQISMLETQPSGAT